MRLLPLAQLLRLPNVFTAFGDILLGTLATGALFAQPLASGLLLAASGCLYCSGMVWNDFFDFDVDRMERPFRPLPSGKIAKRTAAALATILLLLGVAFAAGAGWTPERWRPLPASLAGMLVVAILLYDGWLKHTPIGPGSMAACRVLNMLLGMSLVEAGSFAWNQRWHLAIVVGLYIVGVTWFARNEAGRSKPTHLRAAAAVILAALMLALAVPVHRPVDAVMVAYPYLLVAFGFLVGIPLAVAITKPEPKSVQAAVKRCILGLVVLDAVLASAYVGLYGLLIVLLLPPALWLGKKVYST